MTMLLALAVHTGAMAQKKQIEQVFEIQFDQPMDPGMAKLIFEVIKGMDPGAAIKLPLGATLGKFRSKEVLDVKELIDLLVALGVPVRPSSCGDHTEQDGTLGAIPSSDLPSDDHNAEN